MPPLASCRGGTAFKTGARLTAARLLRFELRLFGDTAVVCAHVAVKTAMEKEQVRERERSRRKTRCCAPFTRKRSSYQTP